jgi:hypothetical protein
MDSGNGHLCPGPCPQESPPGYRGRDYRDEEKIKIKIKILFNINNFNQIIMFQRKEDYI